MCQKCLRRFKRQGLGRLTYGQVKFYAHLMVKGFSIPLFADRRDNFAIEAHIYKMELAKSNKRRT